MQIFIDPSITEEKLNYSSKSICFEELIIVILYFLFSSTTDTPPLLDENEIVPESDSSLSPEPVFRKRNHARKCKKKVTKVSLYDEIDLSEDPEENYQPIFKVVPSSSTSQGDKVRGRKSKRKVKTTTLRNPTVLNEIDLTHDLEGNYEPSFKPDEPSSSKSLLSKNDSFNLDDEVEEEFKIIAMWKTVEKNTFMIRKVSFVFCISMLIIL